MKGLNAKASLINVPDVEHFFDNEGEPTDHTTKYLDQFDEILSEKLDADEKKRVMTFIRGFQLGTTSEEIKTALVSNFKSFKKGFFYESLENFHF